ncbi:MAG: UbiD family decarboxylase [Desulfobulbaceae bacterium]|jgi:UbiD family decarboxylase|nr:UbiD family decarboxylase [Desulfobulbaceae bacterium]
MNTPVLTDLRAYLDVLRRDGDLLTIDEEVDPHLEIAEIHRRVIAQKGPALFFRRVKGSAFPVVTNLFGSERRLEQAFAGRPQRFIHELVSLAESLAGLSVKTLWQKRRLLADGLKIGLKNVKTAPLLEVCQIPPRLTSLPLLTSWHGDGGPFVTLPLVYTEHPEGKGHNLGMYRIQRHDDQTTGIHWQIHKGGGYHYHEAEKLGLALPLTLYIGGPPALILAAIAPLPEDIPELMLASLLLGKKLPMITDPRGGHQLVATAEFAVKGIVPPGRRRPEGPFGDHYGYNSLAHDYPIFQASHLYHRRDAIYPATVVGRPKQEDYYIGDFLQELLSPLFPIAMKGVKQLKTFGETGFHCLAAARVENRYPREAFACGLRVLGEGQLSLSKFLIVTDGDLDVGDFPKLWTHVLERVSWADDLHIFADTAQDTLDYTGPSVNMGSKAMLLGLGRDKRRELPREFHGELPPSCRRARMFLPGTLMVEGESYKDNKDLAAQLAACRGLGEMPAAILIDDLPAATASMQEFLWTVFTRFEPANDIYAAARFVRRFHVGLTEPVVIDCRLKPWYTEVLAVDELTRKKVDQRLPKLLPPSLR